MPLGPASYVPANAAAASPGANHVALWSRLDAGAVDLSLRRSANFAEFADPAPIALTSDPEVDVPGAGWP